jgi:hypothetical protein
MMGPDLGKLEVEIIGTLCSPASIRSGRDRIFTGATFCDTFATSCDTQLAPGAIPGRRSVRSSSGSANEKLSGG